MSTAEHRKNGSLKKSSLLIGAPRKDFTEAGTFEISLNRKVMGGRV
jgi:hypothetical protein